MSNNPYAAPVSDPASPQAPAGGVWRQGSRVVAAHGAQFPAICVKTGLQTTNRVVRKHSWHPPWIMLTILLSPLIYIIIALIIRKSSEFAIAVAPEAVSRRRIGVAIGLLIALLGVGLFVFGAMYSAPGPDSHLGILMPVGALVFIVGVVIGSKLGAYYRIKRIDDRFTILTGAHSDFLSVLPDYPTAAPMQS